jgi:hypothetical protein
MRERRSGSKMSRRGSFRAFGVFQFESLVETRQPRGSRLYIARSAPVGHFDPVIEAYRPEMVTLSNFEK